MSIVPYEQDELEKKYEGTVKIKSPRLQTPNAKKLNLTIVTFHADDEPKPPTDRSTKDSPATQLPIEKLDSPLSVSTNKSSVKFEKITKQQVQDIASLRLKIDDMSRKKGTQHPNTLELYSALGMILRSVREHAEAELYFRKAWEGRKVSHPRPSTDEGAMIFEAETYLAYALHDLRRYQESFGYFQEALAGLERLGLSTGALILTLEGILDFIQFSCMPCLAVVTNAPSGLGASCHAQMMLEAAETHYQRVLEYRQENDGPDSPVTLNAINKLSMVYKDQGRLEDADSLCSFAFTECCKLLGEDNPITQESVGILAFVRYSQGRKDEAEVMYRKALAYQEKFLGYDDVVTSTTVSKIAEILFNKQDVPQAELMHRYSNRS